KASATVPASSGMYLRLNDDRDGSAVRAPGGAGHIRGALRAQETDHGCDFLRLREAPDRPAGADVLQDLITRLMTARRLLVGEAALVEPGACGRRAWSHRVAADAVLRVQVRDEPREGENSGFRDGIVRHSS